jgi:hypothetical protein
MVHSSAPSARIQQRWLDENLFARWITNKSLSLALFTGSDDVVAISVHSLGEKVWMVN